jgi:hypothetical protein
MNALAGKIKSHFANWREWELNPIVVKELRQAVRSWAVTGMLMVFLVVLFIASVGFLISESFDVDANMGLGGRMFSVFAVILAVASILFIPLYVGVRVAAERQENNPDLFYVSTLSPARIIRGKFFCGAYVAVLFFSACMPFMAFSNLLRGVDLPTVFSILFYLFLAVCAVNMIAIFFGCLPLSRPFKILLAVGGFFLSFWVLVPAIAFTFSMMGAGVGTMMGGRVFWMETITRVGIGALVTGLFYVLSVALISPPSMNRALPVRLYITLMWVLSGLLCLAWIWQTKEAQEITAWAVFTFIFMVISLLVVISNSDRLSLRVQRDIPASPVKRAFAFVFFNGAAGGLIWATGIIALTLGVTLEFFLHAESWFPRAAFSFTDSTSDFMIPSAAALAYAFDYALTGLLIQRKFFPNRPPKLAGLLAVLIAAAWALLPSLVLFFLNELTWKSFEGLQLGNAFNVFSSLREGSELNLHLLFSGIWLALAILLNANWFFRQLKAFRPLDNAAKPPPIPAIPPAT